MLVILTGVTCLLWAIFENYRCQEAKTVIFLKSKFATSTDQNPSSKTSSHTVNRRIPHVST
jgi:hypothetical protein